MIDIRPFMPGDLVGFKPQGRQAAELELDDSTPQGLAWTALVDARPICCAGLIEVWQGRAYAWALLSDSAGPHMLGLTREIRSRFLSQPFARIEMAVDADFEAGRRWAVLLGFKLETPEPMAKFLPSGRDAYLYARTR